MAQRLSRARPLALVALLLITLIAQCALADEGMFMPDTLSSLPIDKLKERGLKIPLTDIYNPAGASLKDAIVIIDGGTGEFVSPDGLLLTNHHVAFDALVAASTPANDYVAQGFTARTRAEEIRAPDYTVTITEDLRDVTSEVLGPIPATLAGEERERAIAERRGALEAAARLRAAKGTRLRIEALNDGLSYYMFTYRVLRDVRIVYAPPNDVGQFGGETDNFEWPRHGADFTFMRAYVGADGQPADYAASNVPFKPKKFLSLSLGGVREGDFMMVLGYPGTTRRYRESYSAQYSQDVNWPFLVDLYSNYIRVLEDLGRYNPELRIKLQSDIANYSNSLKLYAGSIPALRRAGLVARRRADEEAFARWVNAEASRKAKYGEVLPGIAKAYQDYLSTAERDLVVQQMFAVTDLVGLAYLAEQFAVNKERPEAERNPLFNDAWVERVKVQFGSMLGARQPTVERELLTYLLRKADELPTGQKIEAIEKRFGALRGEARRRAEADFARSVVDSKRYSTVEGLSSLYTLTTAQMRELHDPLVEFASEIGAEERRRTLLTEAFNETIDRLRPLFVAGMSEMRGAPSYPDANRTLRFAYGEVKGYVPREAIIYQPFTTLSGVMEKDTGRGDFIVPEKLKQLYRARDFGPYTTTNGADVPVDFLSTTDIIGGNSGSPILNGRGEQVGIVFDSNYEGLGNDYLYNEATNRTISVDIRYVLFITEKFGGAGYLLKELDIKNAPARAATSSVR
ncbi:MAG TPA: S46 family peptidase [Pyrinomonadaceae bacterium]